MSFLTKLLAPKQTAGRLPEPETVSKAEHDRLMDDLRATHSRLQRDLRIERDTIGRKMATIRELKAELDTARESNLMFLEQRDAARAEAEANKVDAQRLHSTFGIVAKVVKRMSPDYGYPASDMAHDLEMQKADVLAVLRFLQSAGLAKRHPFFSEDDNKIQGSGYSLTAAGYDLATILPAPVEHPQQAAA